MRVDANARKATNPRLLGHLCVMLNLSLDQRERERRCSAEQKDVVVFGAYPGLCCCSSLVVVAASRNGTSKFGVVFFIEKRNL